MIYNHITELIGDTPLLRLDPRVHSLKNIDVYLKLEYQNPFGSLKDRIAWGILNTYIPEIIDQKRTVIESSSGNTAKAMQVICATYGVPFKTVTNRVKVDEVKNLLRMLGAQIEELPGYSECPDPTDPNDPLSIIEKYCRENPEAYFHTKQYTNEDNYKTHYYTTGREIERDLGVVDYVVGGLGTTGSTRGIINYLKEHGSPKVKGIGVVSDKSDFIPGIRNKDEMFEVGLYDPELYESVETVNSLAAIEATMELVRGSGVMAGPTTGASYEGALQYLRGIDDTCQTRQAAVILACDRIEPYMSYIQKRRPDVFEADSRQSLLQQLVRVESSDACRLAVESAGEWMGSHNPLLIDIRSQVAYAIKHIPGSINIPEEYFKELIGKELPFPEDMNVLLICPSGDKSLTYASYLRQKSISAYSLDGGLLAWRDAGLPFEKGSHAIA